MLLSWKEKKLALLYADTLAPQIEFNLNFLVKWAASEDEKRQSANFLPNGIMHESNLYYNG